MATYRVYISASTQKNNVGVSNYGTEQDRMMYFADRVKYWLNTQGGKFTVFRNQPNWTLQQSVDDCNKLACIAFIDNHTNAGAIKQLVDGKGAEGTEVFYYGQGGINSNSYKLANAIYTQVAPISLGGDRGVKPDTSVYSSGMFVIQKTNPPSALVEHIYHTNYAEVEHFIANVDKYAKAEAIGVCNFVGEKWVDTMVAKPIDVSALIKEMVVDGLITDADLWTRVLKGEVTAKPEYLQIIFGRATSKIR